ncbi:HPr family phosphocarrier protein [Isoptericola variabilis]|uniref:Phosphocarrier protein HPr n=1 Tax=Isoptericola variabilis (strain 225) TaxID=743718 RepID=F6FSU1_ISOV2|nr:HPr family phosphocarrier protein [Isoptericola variabilis]AEG43082.1 Phosphotransferase system, phosphocarrier protein HPr [Isoptericola variabilis 225]TWH35008.1 phosphocarrier protein [Isoptericola variabilis J7]
MERSVVVAIAEGLHARPAALFARAAGRQPVPVRIAKPGGPAVDASSILGLMTLGADAGDEVVLSTEADDDVASAALDELADFLAQESVPSV